MKKIIRLTESDLARIVRRVISEQPTKIKTGESLDDEALLKMACMTWRRFKETSTPKEIQKAKDWTKQYTKTQYPYDMDVVCKSKAVDVIGDDNDRMILKGIIELNWM